MSNQRQESERKSESLKHDIENHSSHLTFPFVFGILLVIFLIWLYVGMFPITKHGMNEKAGQAGDSFGAVNSLFSALVCFFVILAYVSQREELTLQRKELRLALSEYEKMADALEKQTLWQFQSTYLAALNQQLESTMRLAEMDKESKRTTRNWIRDAFALNLYIAQVREHLMTSGYPVLGLPPELGTAFDQLKWLTERLHGHIEGKPCDAYGPIIKAMNDDLGYVEGCILFLDRDSKNLGCIGEEFHDIKGQAGLLARALAEAKEGRAKQAWNDLQICSKNLEDYSAALHKKVCLESESPNIP